MRDEQKTFDIVKLIPSIITLTALCLGLSSIRFAITDQFEKAIIFIVIACFLDGIDGRVARMLNVSSHFGAEMEYTLKGPKPEFTPMGEGDVDFRGFINALVDIGYKGCMVVEYEGGLSGYDGDADKASRDSLIFIEKILREGIS